MRLPVEAPEMGPLGAKEIVADLKGWTVDKPGVWFLELHWNKEMLIQRRMKLNQDSLPGVP